VFGKVKPEAPTEVKICNLSTAYSGLLASRMATAVNTIKFKTGL
jgi:hypothetical protein